jgi:hypothetical protein
MNRADKAREAARRDALASAWAASAKTLRGELEAEALAEFEEDGTGVSWTVRDLGRVTLPLSQEAPVIADIDALVKWVKERHPEHLETIEQVRAAFQTWLLQNVQITTDGDVIDPGTGEIVPGMAVREGNRPKSLSITVEPATKRLLAQYATAEVERLLVAEHGQVSDAAA